MASTPSDFLLLELMATGEKSNTWGDIANTVFKTLERAAAGYTTIAVTSPTTTLSVSNFTLADAHNLHWKLTGTLTANTTVVVPSLAMHKFVTNATTGNFTLTVKTSGGTGVVIPQGQRVAIVCDGTDVMLATTHFGGNAATASKWEVGRTISLSGAVTGSIELDGSANVNITTTLSAHTHGWSQVTDKPTTLGGYGITDALSTSGGTVEGDLRVRSYFINELTQLDGSQSAHFGWRNTSDRGLVFSVYGPTHSTSPNLTVIHGNWIGTDPSRAGYVEFDAQNSKVNIAGPSGSRSNVQVNGNRILTTADGEGWPGTYSGTTVSNTTYPIGTVIAVMGSASRNQGAAPRLHQSDTGEFTLSGSGSLVAGAWRSRGMCSSTHFLAQRVA